MYTIIRESNGKDEGFTVINMDTFKTVSKVFDNHADAMIAKFNLEHGTGMREHVPYGFSPKTN